MAFNSKLFGFAKERNPQIAGEILVNGLSFLLQDGNRAQIVKILENQELSRELNNLNDSNIAPVAEFIGKLIVNPDKLNTHLLDAVPW
ncbi:MAG: hypothetical protein R3D71_03040 [Rickettsiales bacterium]